MAAENTDRDKKKECLRKCGILLAQRDYTCSRLREKLKAAGFEEDIIESVLESLLEAHYIDDERYARNYVQSQWENRSRMRIRMDLESRGVPSDVIAEVMRSESEERGTEAEIRQIRKLMKKRGFDPLSASYDEKNKMRAFLYRKGYDGSCVRAAMDVDLLDSDGFSV